MDIRKIEAFSKVFEHASFSKAAKSLFLSQPTISAHVASLEEELEVALFDRIGRTVVPTKAGEILYQHARKIFEASELAINEIRKLHDRVTGRLEIGGSSIPANYIMPAYLAQFWQMYPEVVMNLHIGDSEEIASLVRENVLMLGVVGGIFPGTDLVYEPIARDELVLVMAPKIYIQYQHLDPVEMLRKVPWVLREEGSGTRAAMDESLTTLGIDILSLNCVIMVRNAGAVARCLSAGMGAAITSAITVADALAAGHLVAIDIPGLIMERSFFIVFHRKRTLFPAAVKLIEFLKMNVTNVGVGGQK